MQPTSKERRNVAGLMRDDATGFRRLREECGGAWTVDLGDVPCDCEPRFCPNCGERLVDE